MHPDGTVLSPGPPPSPPTLAQALAHPRQARRLALHPQRWACHPQGWPGWAMAQPLGLGKNTVFRALRTTTLPARKRRTDRGRSLLTPYVPDRRERWNAGWRDALRLVREIQPRGDPGSAPTVARSAQRLRQAQGEASRPRRRRPPLPRVPAGPHRAWTPRRATGLVLRRPARADARGAGTAHATHSPGCPARQRYRTRPRFCPARCASGTPEHLDPWRARAAVSPLLPLQRCAKGLRDDDDAVTAGVTLPWSHGPVEGHSNRVTDAQTPDVWPCQSRSAPAALAAGGIRTVPKRGLRCWAIPAIQCWRLCWAAVSRLAGESRNVGEGTRPRRPRLHSRITKSGQEPRFNENMRALKPTFGLLATFDTAGEFMFVRTSTLTNRVFKDLLKVDGAHLRLRQQYHFPRNLSRHGDTRLPFHSRGAPRGSGEWRVEDEL